MRMLEFKMNAFKAFRIVLVVALTFWIVGSLAIYGGWHLYLHHFKG